MCTSSYEPSFFYHPLTIKVGPIHSKISFRFPRYKGYRYAHAFSNSSLALCFDILFYLFYLSTVERPVHTIGSKRLNVSSLVLSKHVIMFSPHIWLSLTENDASSEQQ